MSIESLYHTSDLAGDDLLDRAATESESFGPWGPYCPWPRDREIRHDEWLASLDREDLYCAGLDPGTDWMPMVHLPPEPPPKPPPKPPQKPRQPSIKQVEKDSGKIVTSVAYAPDGTRTYRFGQPSVSNEPNPWNELYDAPE